MKYIVSVQEVHIQFVVVEANSAKEAVKAVVEGEGNYLTPTEYSRTLDTAWSVDEETKKGDNNESSKSIR